MNTLSDLLFKSKVIVMLGAGGVGKTTSSIVLALAAARSGRKVALLSIDPAKRLAAALGIPLSHEPAPLIIPASYGLTGSVAASMLDQKAVFDQMVERHSPTTEIAERIKSHSIYQAAASNMGGPLEYMALAKLQDLSSDPRYDLVILDTPPDTHALEFLARPNILSSFMDAKVMNWLVKPFLVAGRFGLGKLFSAGERLMGGIAKVAGFDPLRQFAEFLILMQDVIEGFHKSGEATSELLHRATTSFVFVSVATHGAKRSVQNLANHLRSHGYYPDLLLVNRCLPALVTEDLQTRADFAGLLPYRSKALGERQVVSELSSLSPNIWQLPEREHDPGDIAGLMQLVEELP